MALKPTKLPNPHINPHINPRIKPPSISLRSPLLKIKLNSYKITLRINSFIPFRTLPFKFTPKITYRCLTVPKLISTSTSNYSSIASHATKPTQNRISLKLQQEPSWDQFKSKNYHSNQSTAVRNYSYVPKRDQLPQGQSGFFYTLKSMLGSFMLNCFTTIPTGHVGVIDTFGSVSDRILNPGLHIISPASSVILFSAKTQEAHSEVHVTSKDGDVVNLEVGLLYKIRPKKATALYSHYGKNYQEMLITPTLNATVCQTAHHYDSTTLRTSSHHPLLSIQLSQLLKQQLSPRGIVVEEIFVKNAVIPNKSASVSQNIVILVMDKQQLEGDRKAFEAQVRKLLAPQGTDATLQSSDSNPKIVILGKEDGTINKP